MSIVDGKELLERLEMFADHGAANMESAQELMSDALLEIKRLTRLAPQPGMRAEALDVPHFMEKVRSSFLRSASEPDEALETAERAKLFDPATHAALSASPADPKPALDAMREAHEAFDRMLRSQVIEECIGVKVKLRGGLGGKSPEYLAAFQDGCNAFIDALRALSAPVPPPPSDDVRSTLAEKIEKAWRWNHVTSNGMFVESLTGDEQNEICAALRSAPVSAPARETLLWVGEPVVRDTNMFSRLANEPLAVIPEGYSAPLDFRTAAEIQHDRLAKKSTQQNAVREAAIEECAKICDRWVASKNLHEHLAATDIKAAIRALASPQKKD